MVRFAQLLGLVLVLTLVVTEGLPWLKERLGSDPGSPPRAGARAEPAADEDPAECVNAAQRSADRIGDRMRTLGPNATDSEELAGVLAAIEDDIFAAESVCGCPEESCRRAGEALAQLRALVHDLGAGNPWGNPAYRLEQAYRLLEEARSALP